MSFSGLDVFSLVQKTKKIFAPWDLGKPEDVKRVCDDLEIPFYAVDLQQEFIAKIEEFVISSRLDGRFFPTDMMIHKLLIDTLVLKAEQLKCDRIATGHYVKMTNIKGQINLISANDVQVDQSHLFSLVDFQQLKKMEFPLAEVRHEQADDIAEMMKIEFLEENGTKDFGKYQEFRDYLEQKVPFSMIKEGTIYRWESGITLGDHRGLVFHYLGENELNTQYNPVPEAELTIVKIDPINSAIYLDYIERLKRNAVILDRCQFMDQVDQSVPFKAYARFSTYPEKKIEVTIIPKSLNRVEVHFEEEEEGLFLEVM